MPLLLSLPAELRDWIYDYCFRNTTYLLCQHNHYFVLAYKPYKSPKHFFTYVWAWIPENPPVWMLANKQILHEARAQFYRHAACYAFADSAAYAVQGYRWSNRQGQCINLESRTTRGLFRFADIMVLDFERYADRELYLVSYAEYVGGDGEIVEDGLWALEGTVKSTRITVAPCSDLNDSIERPPLRNLPRLRTSAPVPLELILDVKLNLNGVLYDAVRPYEWNFNLEYLEAATSANIFSRVEFVINEPAFTCRKMEGKYLMEELGNFVEGMPHLQLELMRIGKLLVGERGYKLRTWLADSRARVEGTIREEGDPPKDVYIPEKWITTRDWHVEVRKAEGVVKDEGAVLGLWRFHAHEGDVCQYGLKGVRDGKLVFEIDGPDDEEIMERERKIYLPIEIEVSALPDSEIGMPGLEDEGMNRERLLKR